jgi:cholesterol oxidase
MTTTPDDPGTADTTPEARPASAVTSVRFTEEMKGFITLDESDHETGARLGRTAGTRCMFHLTIQINDVDAFQDDPVRRGTCQGWVDCDVLGGKRLVERGDFQLFVDDDDDPGRRWMRYRLWFRDAAGHPLTLVGFKDVHDDAGFDVWTDTSTLFTRILAGHVEPDDDAEARVVAAGILTIWMRDFARQLTTFRASGPTIADRFRGLGLFVGVFLRQLKQVYVSRRKAD